MASSTADSHISLKAVFTGSLLFYPLLFRAITPRTPSVSRFSKSREAISAFHCTLVTVVSLYELRRQRHVWMPQRLPAPPQHQSGSKIGVGSDEAMKAPNGASMPIITARSSIGNCLAALECAYLVQDTVVLLLGAQLRSRQHGTSLVKEINWRLVGWHHCGLAAAFGVLQWYIARGKEKGMLVILMLMLMNAS